jgi:hypothetical protein
VRERASEAFIDGFSNALVFAAVVAFVGAVVAAVLVRPHEIRPETAADAVPEVA